MATPVISVVITTAPGREAHLRACLTALCGQVGAPPFEVLVCDDGSAGGEAVVAESSQRLKLRYFWRPHDLCPNRSRNTGIFAAAGELIVLIDGDVLLNPYALLAYAHHLQTATDCVWLGYFGSLREFYAPSALVPGRIVNYLDKRFFCYGTEGLMPLPPLLQWPETYTWTANLAFSRKLALALNGFDENFICWGHDDLEFARRVLIAGHQLHFSLDAWGEHQLHPFDEPFHRPGPDNARRYAALPPPPPLNYRVQVACDSATRQLLCRQILLGYVQQDEKVSPDFRAAFRQPGQVLMVREDEKGRWMMAHARREAVLQALGISQ